MKTMTFAISDGTFLGSETIVSGSNSTGTHNVYVAFSQAESGTLAIQYKLVAETKWRRLGKVDLTGTEVATFKVSGIITDWRFVVADASGTGSIEVTDSEKLEDIHPLSFYGETGGMSPTEIGDAIKLFGSYTNKGAWATGIEYTTGDVWTDSGDWYLVLETYTSGASAAADIASGVVAQYEPASRVTQVSTIADLRNTNPIIDGQQIELLGHTVAGVGGGIFYADYSDATSADNNGTIIVTPNGRRWKRKFDGKVFVTWFGAIGNGTHDDSEAFQSAVNAYQNVHVPSCQVYYLVGGLTIPDERNLTGERIFRYTAFNVSDISGYNAIVYDTSKPTFIRWGLRCSAFKCSFHGVNRSRPFFDTGSNPASFHMLLCSVYRCRFGLGANTEDVGGLNVTSCHFNGNTVGLRNLIDSQVSQCVINANEQDGVVISAGSNDSVYVNNKVEWNNAKGFNIFGGQSSVQIIGGIVDRNGEAGISLTANAGVAIDLVKFRRNGRLSESNPEQDAHIALRGGVSPNLQINGIDTATGGNDDGTGYVSPRYSIAASNSTNTAASITGSNLTGSTSTNIQVRSSGSLSSPVFSGNTVDSVAVSANLGNGSDNNGYIFPNEVVFSGAAANYSSQASLVMGSLPQTGTFSRTGYDLFLVTRRTDVGTTSVQRYILTVSRESGSATVNLENYVQSSTNPGVSASSNNDGTEVTVTLTPSAGTLTTEAVLTYFR